MTSKIKSMAKTIVTLLIPDSVALLFAQWSRWYMRNAPSNNYIFYLGKRFLWTVLLKPVVNWRDFSTFGSTKFGVSYNVRFPDFIQQMIYYFGVWEPPITRIMQQCLSEGSIFVDVGANIGYNSCLASKLVGTTGRVHAIEASPSIFATLLENIALNKAENITPYSKAVYDRETKISLYKGPISNIGYSTTSQHRARRDDLHEEAAVIAQPLQMIVPAADLYEARLIKIDVEGAEWFVINGIRDHLGRFSSKTEWLIELNPTEIREQGGDVDVIVKLFTNAGYKLYMVENKYDVGWYIKESDCYGTRRLGELLSPAPRTIRTQVDIFFTKHVYT